MADVTDDRTIPVPDRDTAPYWAALADGRFLLQRCDDCGHWTWPTRPICSGCHGEQLAWTEPSGTGEVYSWVVTHQAYGPGLAGRVPYIVALVRVDEQDDILIPGRYLSDEVDIHQGLRVQAATERVADDIGVLHWRAATE
jgi:uncharacterized protein